MKNVILASFMTLFTLSTAAYAEFQTVTNQSDFVSVVSGKKLTRPLVELRVSPDGAITGTGAVWDVSGKWTWKDGYFCRTLEWGGDSLGYNCQEVAISGRKIRFIADKGAGKSADFQLR